MLIEGKIDMQDRYWMFQRKGVLYVQDKLSGVQKSLKTRDAAAAKRMVAGKNQATEQPQMNMAIDLLPENWAKGELGIGRGEEGS